eukprot:TRINITY_DN58123_c0_g1_i1.p1 TRINITY_DN58123_c0_g1~~TRINITY_DN58123_c0_g1_i1.p1  ORF type:complete len:521 (-),score=55.85 TRINITY_DN58123_c0_g1_i1:106-1668(-)
MLSVAMASNAGADEHGTSRLSLYFASKKRLPCPEEREQASLADIAVSMCKSSHSYSQRYKPCTKLLTECYSMADRQETLIWLVQAFGVMEFSDSLLHATALLLDRYYACLPKDQGRDGESQRKLLAAVCMALKLGADQETGLSLRKIVAHLSRGQLQFDEVMAAELCMLRKLQFDVGTPTPRDFLDTLSARLVDFHAPESSRNLADYLLQLSLSDAVLHYTYPHSVLAAAALLLALHATRAAMAAQSAVIEDLALHCQEALPSGNLAQCSTALHQIWLASFRNQDQTLYSHHVRQKFASAKYNSVSRLQPPAVAPSILPVHNRPAIAPIHGSSAADLQNELDVAVSIVHQSLMADVAAYSVAPEERRYLRCKSCSRTWHSTSPPRGLCTKCKCPVEAINSSGREPVQWLTSLTAKLRTLAETSWKLQRVLVRHGWTQNSFRCPPDRQNLLRDLLYVSRGAQSFVPSMAPVARGPMLQDMPSCTRRQGTGGEHRRTRASSWCGHRYNPSMATTCATLLRSP